MSRRGTGSGAAALALLALFLLAAGAWAVSVDLSDFAEGETVPVGISGEAANRVEFPEKVLGAFTSSGSMDVKIVGRSALVRAGEEAELIVLTEKRRLTLMLVPEDGPSRTVILRAGAEVSPPGGEGEEAGRPAARELERRAVGLVLSLLREEAPAEVPPAPRLAAAGGLFLSAFASAADGDLEASAYLVGNGGRREAALSEGDLASESSAVAVWVEKGTLGPGELSRAVVVRRGETGR